MGTVAKKQIVWQDIFRNETKKETGEMRKLLEKMGAENKSSWAREFTGEVWDVRTMSSSNAQVRILFYLGSNFNTIPNSQEEKGCLRRLYSLIWDALEEKKARLGLQQYYLLFAQRLHQISVEYPTQLNHIQKGGLIITYIYYLEKASLAEVEEGVETSFEKPSKYWLH